MDKPFVYADNAATTNVSDNALNAMLPYLMKYMGHASIVSTYYYIHLLPDFYPQYKSLISISESLIPEVDYEI